LLSHYLFSRELTTRRGYRNRLILFFLFLFLFLCGLGRGIFFGGALLFDVFLLG